MNIKYFWEIILVYSSVKGKFLLFRYNTAMYVCIFWTWALKNLDEPVSGTCEVDLYVFRSARSSAKRNLLSSLEQN